MSRSLHQLSPTMPALTTYLDNMDLETCGLESGKYAEAMWWGNRFNMWWGNRPWWFDSLVHDGVESRFRMIGTGQKTLSIGMCKSPASRPSPNARKNEDVRASIQGETRCVEHDFGIVEFMLYVTKLNGKSRRQSADHERCLTTK
jgi:hypothetical protein